MLALFDIGGTHIRIGVAQTGNTIDKTIIVRTPQDFSEGVRQLVDHIRGLAGIEKITGMCGGIAGVLTKEKSGLATSPNLPLWIGKPLVDTLSKTLDAPCLLQNDAALGGLGEAVYGAGKGQEIIAYIAVGTGVGGSRIVSGRIDMSAQGFEPGHQIIAHNGKEDACGPQGHWEAYISGKALKLAYGKAPEDISDPAVWHEVAHFFAVGIQNTIVHWSPDIVVVGGSVGLHIPLTDVSLELGKLLTIFPKAPKIAYGTLGKLSVLYGSLTYLQTKGK